MSRCDFRALQRALTTAIREQGDYDPPCGNAIEARRVRVYRELFFNNFSQFFASGYPVCRALLDDAAWQRLIGDFLRCHGAHTPLFHLLGRELLDFLRSDAFEADAFPPWLADLADWEWREVEVSIVDAPAPPAWTATLTPDAALALSPLARVCHYAWPVHALSPQSPQVKPEPTWLLIWRDRDDAVHFARVAPLMGALLTALDGETPLADWLAQMAESCGMAADALFEMAAPFLVDLLRRGALQGGEDASTPL